jgi:hypothetical protein
VLCAVPCRGAVPWPCRGAVPCPCRACRVAVPCHAVSWCRDTQVQQRVCFLVRSFDHPDRQARPTRLLRPACSHAPRASQTLDGHHEVEFRVCVRVRPATGLGEAVFQDLERGPCRHILLGPAFPALRHCTSLGEAGEAALPTQLNRAGTRPRGVGAAGKVARLPCAGRRRRSWGARPWR